jgi:hypothetical protein
MAVALAPAVPAQARELRLRIEEISWSTLAAGELRKTGTSPGPWEFAVGL